MLFAPGNKERMLQKSLGAGADSVIWDLEDAVALAEKDSARAAVGAALRSLPQQHVPIVVRINAVSANMLEADLANIVKPGLHGVLLPKAESASDVHELERSLARLEKANGLAQGAIKIRCILETCLGVLNAYAVAIASSRIEALCFGAEDFTLDLGVSRTREGIELAHAREEVALAAGAAKIMAIDTVYAFLDDEDGLIQECRAARRVGFRGKFAIHPRQLEIINREFSPSESELAFAEKVVQAFTEAQQRNQGVITVDGRMIDAPVAERARLLLRSYKKKM
jgi:citrate lyase subunit beta/citryl-CoA lyase